MTRTIALILILAAPANAGQIEIAEIPDPFNPIPLTEVFWAKRSKEGKAAREACGGDFEFVGHRWEGRTLVHLVECKG